MSPELRPLVEAAYAELERQGGETGHLVNREGVRGTTIELMGDFDLAPLVEAVLAAQWRPIETAPKDGTDILGWWPHDGMHVVFWSSDGWGTCMTKGEWTPPVMWQHLPPPPKDPPTPA